MSDLIALLVLGLLGGIVLYLLQTGLAARRDHALPWIPDKADETDETGEAPPGPGDARAQAEAVARARAEMDGGLEIR